MLFRVIDKEELPSLISGFAKSYDVIGAVAHDGAYVYDEIGNDPSRFVPDYDTTVSSVKRYLFPAREELFRFDLDDQEHPVAIYEGKPQVLFGLHACDINGIRRLDEVYLSDDCVDPYYAARRNSTLIVGMSCTPQPTCFCKAFGTDEAFVGYDMFLYDLGDRYFIVILSVEAAEILELSCHVRQASDADTILFREKKQTFDTLFPEIPDFNRVPLLIEALYDNPLWDELGCDCLSCSACATVCPTCHCFTTADEVDFDGKHGARYRMWDACTSPEFSRIAHGIDFRPTTSKRVRNRFYHKLLGFRLNHGHTLCVGCGRCSKACKMGITPVRLVRMLNEAEIPQGGDN